MTDDVVQVMTQLGPIMKQLSGVDVEALLRDLSRLPGAVADRVGGTAKPTGKGASKKGADGKVFGD